MDIGEGLRQAVAKLTGATIIDAKTIREFNKELQKTLLSADVEVKLVFELTKRIEEVALKERPPEGISHKDYIVDIVYKELVKLMGPAYKPELKPQRILLMGLYGAGKTTTAAKLAKYYQDRGLSAGLICCDLYRPAAYEQLETLAKNANVGFFGDRKERNVEKIVTEGLATLKDKQIIICDTSGRNALDSELADELRRVGKAFSPTESILVIGSDTGQVAGRQAREFNAAVKISGVIITRMDGSSKGGGALSAANSASAHALFIGIGEKLNDLLPFDPEKFVGGLLGIPDIQSLLEKVNAAVAEAGISKEEMQVEELNMESFYTQLKAMNKMGPLKNVMGMMGASNVPKEFIDKGEERMKKFKVIISSMTEEERKNERMLHDSSRIRRIAKGSGTTEKDVHDLISDFNKMKKMFGMVKNDRGLRKRFSKFMQ
ncbi:MAG: signal recognition particle protein [Nitrososphaerota archaeon]|nr:signal recognition particle protein [Nitrososphaerota archaeon]